MSSRGLEGEDWATQTPRLRTLELDFAVRCTDPVLGGYLGHVLSPFEADGEPREWWSIAPHRDDHELLELWIGDEISGRRRAGHPIVEHVLWRVNREAIHRSRSRFVLLHASAAVRDGRAVAFPAAMESGKTTLVAGLVRSGFEYLTDEAVAIDPDTLLVHPFPKALSIDPGSWQVLADLRPELDEAAQPFAETQWHVPVGDIRSGATAGPAPIEHFVFPRYDPTRPTELTAMPRSEAFLAAAENAFNLRDDGRRGFHALAESIRRAECHRLSVRDLDDACDLVAGLVTR